MHRFYLVLISSLFFQSVFGQMISKPSGVYFRQSSLSETGITNALRNSKLSEPYSQKDWEINSQAISNHNAYLDNKILNFRTERADLANKRQFILANQDLKGLMALLQSKKDSLQKMPQYTFQALANIGLRGNYLAVIRSVGSNTKLTADDLQRVKQEMAKVPVSELNGMYYAQLAAVQNAILDTTFLKQSLKGKLNLKGTPFYYSYSANKKFIVLGAMCEVQSLMIDSSKRTVTGQASQMVACVNLAQGEAKVKADLKKLGMSESELAKIYAEYKKSHADSLTASHNEVNLQELQKQSYQAIRTKERLKLDILSLEERIKTHKELVGELLSFYELPKDTSFSKDVVKRLSYILKTEIKQFEDSILLYFGDKYEQYEEPVLVKENLVTGIARSAIAGLRVLKARKAIPAFIQYQVVARGADTTYTDGRELLVLREVKELWLMPIQVQPNEYRMGLVARYKLVKGEPVPSEDLSGCRGCTDLQRKVVDEIALNMASIPAGEFLMGCKEGDVACEQDEKPTQQIAIDAFMLNKFEVTQRQWEALMYTKPSDFKGCPDCPVEQVSWEDALAFIGKLNELTGKVYRLPTEPEWEYAARGGENYLYPGGNNLNDVAWFGDNSGNVTHPVGQKVPNAYGLYDMIGNVWEWCSDWYGVYPGIYQSNPKGPAKGSFRVIRGGGWNSKRKNCRISARYNNSQANRYFNLGFRIAMSQAQ